MTKITLTTLAVLAIITGSALAGPKSDQANGWQAQQTDFQLQGR